MKRVTLQDIVPLKEYDARHDEWRRKIIEIKSRRRVFVGRFAAFVFENFDTVRFQIQEMLRVERISESEKVRFEIDTYNALLPRRGELTATLFLEIDSPSERKKLLPLLVGFEKSVSFRCGDRILSRSERVESFVPEEAERPDYASSVYFLRFPFDEKAKDVFLTEVDPIWLTVEHPSYGASERLSGEVLAALRGSLTDAEE